MPKKREVCCSGRCLVVVALGVSAVLLLLVQSSSFDEALLAAGLRWQGESAAQEPAPSRSDNARRPESRKVAAASPEGRSELSRPVSQWQTTAAVPTTQSTTTAPKPLGSDRYLDVVISWYCEREEWFKDITDLPLVVYSKKKACTPRLKDYIAARKDGGENVKIKELENVGREGHSYLHHILKNWDNLATYTAFVQGAGVHNGVRFIRGIREFLSKGNSTRVASWPLVHWKGDTPTLYIDSDPDSRYAKGGMDDQASIYHFGWSAEGDLGNRARDTYISIFGGDACDAPPLIFFAGANMIIHREAIWAKPKSFWRFLHNAIVECVVYGWDLERMWLYVFDPKTPPAQKMGMPAACSGRKHKKCSKYKYPSSPWKPERLPEDSSL
eukprot:TRINITY_DN93237_c0_g1_i1.p1 TRINITY_DN93237_c0_g1~~TRINITY_DN93237_c0_g1_i1.p1  ORF type:complete len:385 (+),score=43.70 TRINITY_DN93237_c0_g1_i1:96-1250(+)